MKIIRWRRPFFLLFLMVGTCSYIKTSAQSKKVAEVPFLLSYDHIIIKLSVNNSEPLNFMFDSGAGGTLILNDVADSLGLAVTSTRKNIGVSGAHEVGVIKGVDMKAGHVKLKDLTLLSTTSSFEQLDNGQRVHGIIGYPLLSNYVVELDYSHQILRFYNRNSFTYSGEGQRLPIQLEMNLPLTKAKVLMYNGTEFEGNFLVDTGARSDLLISSPTVIKYNMATNIGDYYNVRSTIGTSDRKSKMRYGRLQSFHIAGYKFDDIPVALSSDNRGVLSLPGLDGIIGNRLLKRFNLIFDYQNGVIYLTPSILIGTEYQLNATGFVIIFNDGKPFVKNLIERSPADMAGIRDGDEIISINGELVENLSSDSIREKFYGSGEKVELVIKRNNKYKYTAFTLKELI